MNDKENGLKIISLFQLLGPGTAHAGSLSRPTEIHEWIGTIVNGISNTCACSCYDKSKCLLWKIFVSETAAYVTQKITQTLVVF